MASIGSAASHSLHSIPALPPCSAPLALATITTCSPFFPLDLLSLSPKSAAFILLHRLPSSDPSPPCLVAFPSLENLELGGLPNVSDLWCNEISTESFSKLRFLKMEDCHGLVRNVVPAHILKMSPNLENVEILNCDLVEEVFGYVGHQGDALENIRTLIVRCCGSLGNMFSPSIARCLAHLQKLIIDDCLTMEAVVPNEDVANEDDEQDRGERIYVPLFLQLKHLELRDLSSLRRFFHTIHDWEMPFLYHVEALNCPEMQTFSPGFVHTPKLQHVKVEEPNWWNAKGNQPESIWIDDLNKTIQHLFEKQQQDEEDEEEEEEQQRIDYAF